MRFTYFILTLTVSITSHALDWWAVTPNETMKAACMDLNPTSEKTMVEFLESKTSDPDLRVNATIRGLEFKNEIPELIEIFAGIHSRPIWEKDSAMLKPVYCDKVMCAMEKMYGKKAALRMMYIFAKFGLPTSPEAAYKPENYQKWKSDELDDIIVALESLPPTVLPLKNRYILHFLSGYTLASYNNDGGRVVANARMDIFDSWNEHSRMERISTILHELGHVLGTDLDDTPEWKSLPKKFISGYAKTNEAEDFAESFLAYRFAPNKLKKVSQERYDFIKEKLFKGLEFKKINDCEAPFLMAKQEVQQNVGQKREVKNWVNKNKSEISTQVKRQEEMGYFKDKAWAACGSSYLNEHIGSAKREDTEACISRVIKKRSAIVEARKQENEDLKENQIPSSQMQDITVSRRKISLVRQQLREKALIHIEDFYANEFSFISDLKRCQESLEFKRRYSKDSPIKIAPEAISSLIEKGCQQVAEGGFIRQMIGPCFEGLLK